MLPATPLRQWSSLMLLGTGVVLLVFTRPQIAPQTPVSDEKSASCLSNLRQISRAYALYARDFDGKIALGVDPEDRFNNRIWRNVGDESYGDFLQSVPFLHVVLRPYVDAPEVFRCPSDAGWTVSRLQTDRITGENRGLSNVHPSSFAKYGTSYYSWTKYGFDLKTFADIPDPGRRVLLFDGDSWHGSKEQGKAGELFMDGHAALLNRRQHDDFRAITED